MDSNAVKSVKGEAMPRGNKMVVFQAEKICERMAEMEMPELVATLNAVRRELHKVSPFAGEPVDFVEWVQNDKVVANDYNPNTVAPPEMKLLEVSISTDGYTQPIVSWMPDDGNREVIDGFHRHRVGKESAPVQARVMGYLPVVTISQDQEGRNDRIASTIRHNRARGKHRVNAMSDIVVELKNRNWKNSRIARELGMDEDEILRLCQITGLADLFKDDEFSKSWDIEDSEADFIPLSDQVSDDEKAALGFRTINTDDANRVFHTYDKWECHKAGFYESKPPGGKTKDECEQSYYDVLTDKERFSSALERVIAEWERSCEHYLTNASMNRIAWLGQAAVCYATGVPCAYRGGFFLLDEKQQQEANGVAMVYLNRWLLNNNRDEVTINDALTKKQVNTY
jgi:ParB-like chromosome segregation protein Spo0J